MKDTIKAFFGSIGMTVWALVLIAIVAAALFFGWKYLYPETLAVRREAVEQSKSFTDSFNIALANYAHEYASLEVDIAKAGEGSPVAKAYEEQQGAILLQMCRMISTMKADTIAPDTLVFISQHGGCR